MKKFDIMTLGVPMVEFTRDELDVPLTRLSGLLCWRIGWRRICGMLYCTDA